MLALEQFQPDIVLLEGPPDAEPVISLAQHEEMQPPIALLIYPSEGDSREAAYYPFTDFSPEWNALRYALRNGLPARFIDLPQCHQMAMELERVPRPDPFCELAAAAGYADGERCWEQLVEHQADGDIFSGILEVMRELRNKLEDKPSQREAMREAWMRRCIRQAQKEGFQRIAVVCGAWHAPALVPESWPKASADEALLKGLPKRKVDATWIPWTYDRMSFASGYGAGVESPEYYHLVWQLQPAEVAVRWMVAAAQLLRSEDLPASPAGAVEAVRLAETLAGLRGQRLPSLIDLEEAAKAVFCLGAETPMALIYQRLVIGQRLGSIPETAPQLPLARDLAANQKRLRLLPEAAHKDIDLDLRKPNDLERSRLLHRLKLIEIDWGDLRQARGTGTFRESWRLQWKPEFAMELVQAAPYGNTVVEAAQSFVIDRARKSSDLATLTQLAELLLVADLPQALDSLLLELQARSALSNDPSHLLETLPPFARLLRYPDVRQTDAAMLEQLLTGLMERIAIGLPLACASLDDDAAEAMLSRIQKAHSALQTLNEERWSNTWTDTLRVLANQSGLHGLVAGRVCWILLDTGILDQEESNRRLALALGHATQPAQAAAWIEGFLRENGELLVHTPELFRVLDEWLNGLADDRFTEVLPLLRRTFSSFSNGVRQNLGALLKQGGGAKPEAQTGLHPQRAALVLPVIRQIFGIGVST